MTLGILTTITNPDQRQDRWLEALSCYLDLADEVVVVDGSTELIKIPFKDKKLKQVHLPWPHEWSWIELPKHLNYGLSFLNTSWVLKMDIDQFIHEDDFKELRKRLEKCPRHAEAMTFQKISMTYGKKYYEKGGQQIAFKNLPEIKIGKDFRNDTDLCFAVWQTGTEEVWDWEGKIDPYELPVGRKLKEERTGVKYWNYDYFFKTKDFTKKEFWRFSKAYHRYFQSWRFGKDEEDSFKTFLKMQKSRYDQTSYIYELEEHPKYIRDAVKNLTPEQFGYNAWSLL